MNSLNRFISLGLACACLFTISRSANAYIDAGSGSYLLQILLAGVLAGAYVAKTALLNFKSAIMRKFRPVKPDDASTHVE